MRTDARRNREAILHAARDLVSAHGADVTMEELAAHARVAVGTLYRHFPTKADLVEAVVLESLERMAVLAERARDAAAAGEPPGEVFADLFRRLSRGSAEDAAVKRAAAALGLPSDIESLSRDPAGPAARTGLAVQALLAAAQAAGALRDDVTLDDLVLFLTLVPGGASSATSRELYLDVVLRGLRPPT